MTWHGDLTEHSGLWVLDFVENPERLLERGRSADITNSYMLEITAWCAELNEQLNRVAEREGVDLQLMGGNAASLRLDASAQRGSRDNDYLTTATASEVQRLMDSLAAHFSALPEPLLRPKKHDPAGKMPLPMVTYHLTVPSLTVGNRETLEAKIEFHLEDELPPGEVVTGQPFSAGRSITSTLPALPYQVGLKLIVFDDPPVGIPPARDDNVPRQMHDVDCVAALMHDPADWAVLGPYVERRYAKERAFQELEQEAGAPWDGIVRRMARWATCTDDAQLWTQIQNFQSGQVGKATRRPAGEWRARANRIAVMARAAGAGRSELYLRALALEDTVDPSVVGKAARSPRAQIGALSGEEHWNLHRAKLNGFGLRVTFWEVLAARYDLEATLDELGAVLSELVFGA